MRVRCRWFFAAFLAGGVLVLDGCGGLQHAVPPQALNPGVEPKAGAAVALLGDTERQLNANYRTAKGAGQSPRFVVVESKGKKHRFTVFAQIVRTDKFVIARGYQRMYVFPLSTAHVFYNGTDVTNTLPIAQLSPKLAKIVQSRSASVQGEYVSGKPTAKNHLATTWAGLKDPWQIKPDYVVADGFGAAPSSSRRPQGWVWTCNPSFTQYDGPCYYYYDYYPIYYYRPYVEPVSVVIDSADIASNNIAVSVYGGNSGHLTVAGQIAGGARQTLYNADVSSDTQVNFPFYTGDGSSMTIGQWTQLDAQWTPGGHSASDSRSLSFYVMGSVRHSQYNTPDEASCSGGPVGVILYNPSNCVASSSTYRSQFASQVQINGSGRPLSGGFCSIENGCGQLSSQTAFDYPIAGPKGQCGQFVTTGSVAVALGSGAANLQCGDSVLEISGPFSTVKTVVDKCPACYDVSTYLGTHGHIDDYTTDTACFNVVDAGNFVTIRINR